MQLPAGFRIQKQEKRYVLSHDVFSVSFSNKKYFNTALLSLRSIISAKLLDATELDKIKEMMSRIPKAAIKKRKKPCS